MLRRLLTAACAVVLPLSVLPGSAAMRAAPVAPPAGAISSGVQFLANLPELQTAISIDFLGTTMFASTVTGIYAYDVTDPATPKLVGALPQYIWENEDVQIDQKRKLLFLSRDPRGFTSPATTAFPYGAVQVIDISNPTAMVQLSMTLLPSGHTTSCVDGCNYTWTAGPATGQTQPSDWGGRPVFALDMRDPAHPVQCPHPIDEHRNDGKTDYTHDVQVDSAGIAWVSGSGGIRGYWVNGTHRNAQTGQVQKATGCDPVPYAGGGTDLGQLTTVGGVMHNSLHPAWNKKVLLATEEVTVTNCAKSGKFATYSLDGSYGGAGFRSTPAHRFRLKVLDTWTPEHQPGSTGCDSAHYFSDRGDGITANAFYTQGTRFLDVRDPKHITQVAYYRPNDANTWAAYWRPGGYVFVADFGRGVDILKVTLGKHGKAVSAPGLPARSLVNLPSRDFGWMCQVPLSVAATRPELVARR
ncbi:MAG: putative secreted protein [Frankiales bacterium]|nr:putative secreted protein [Frankiales bacterium]